MISTKTSSKNRIKKETHVQVQGPTLSSMKISIIGDSPLIIQAFGIKKRREMLAKQMGLTIQKTPKDPDLDYEQATYYIDEDGFEIPWTEERKDIKNPVFGFPTAGPKHCAVRGASRIKGVTMTAMKGAFDPDGTFIKINGKRFIREDMVVLASGVADIRFRPCWNKWWSEFSITYDADVVTPDLIINMFNNGGFCCGLGEWRPSSPKKSGPYGKFHVATDEEISELKKMI